MTRLRNKLLVAALSLLVPLAVVELGLRIAGYDPFGDMLSGMRDEPGELLSKDFLRESDDEVLVYELAPNAKTHAWEADIETNAYGFRDREYALEKPAGVERIVALGDSATFGVKLAPEVLWPELLEARSPLGDTPLEVLNLGIVGYDALEEVAFFERVGAQFAPDLVIVALHINDLGYASPTREYIQRVSTYGSPWYRVRLLQFVRSRLDALSVARQQKRLASDEVFVTENARWITPLDADDPQIARIDAFAANYAAAGLPGEHRYVKWFGSRERVGKLRFAFERLAHLGERDGFEVAVFCVPWLGDAGNEAIYDAAYEIARAEAEHAGFAFVPVVHESRSAGHDDLRIDKRDFGHPNARGHRIIANVLADWLRAHLAR